jgi:enediyne biosynthesis protein E4
MQPERPRPRRPGSTNRVSGEPGAVQAVGGEGRWGGGVAVVDYDTDGWPDLFVTNFGANVLYRNRGDGTFGNVAAAAGVESPGWNTGAAFFDADGDGDLDLYIAAYIEATMDDVLKARRVLNWKGVDKVAIGPFGLPGALDHFYLNDGHGHFTDATAQAGLEDKGRGYGFTVRAADLSGDGLPDIYVTNDSDANYLYRNSGDGTFKEIGLWAGAALDKNGAAQAGMGVAVGDANGDGIADIFVTNFSEDFSTLYVGLGDAFFADASDTAGVGQATFAALSWGTAFADLDNDGDEDLVVMNGHLYPQVDQHPEFGQKYAQRNLLLENTGGGSFVDATDSAGPGFAPMRSSRGLAVGDYDNDGDLDLLVSNLDEPPTLLRNDSAAGAWLTVVCEVPPGKGPLIGTRVDVHAGGRTMTHDVASSGSFMSAHDTRLHFGLGAAKQADLVTIHWPDGKTTELREVPANQFLKVRED